MVEDGCNDRRLHKSSIRGSITCENPSIAVVKGGSDAEMPIAKVLSSGKLVAVEQSIRTGVECIASTVS